MLVFSSQWTKIHTLYPLKIIFILHFIDWNMALNVYIVIIIISNIAYNNNDQKSNTKITRCDWLSVSFNSNNAVKIGKSHLYQTELKRSLHCNMQPADVMYLMLAHW